MNILFLDSIERDVFGGVENWIGFVTRGLMVRGHCVTVAGRAGSEFLRRTRLAEPGVTILELDISGDFNPVTITRIKKYIKAHQIEVVVANCNKALRLGGLAARWHGKTKVVWRAGIDLTRNNLVHRWLTPRLLDGIIVPSHALKDQITRFGHIVRDMVHVIPTGIDGSVALYSFEHARKELQLKYQLPEDCLIAVTSGRFISQKGHAYLVEAARQIVTEYTNIRFLLLGDGPLESSLRQQIAEAGLLQHFIFAGLLDSFELELSGADIMLHPSIEEPFGIALLEGMRAGLPIVASRVGGIPEVVEEGITALLVEPRQPDALASAAISLLGDHARLTAFGQAARERQQHEFSYDVMLDRVEDYLTRITSGGTPCG